MAESGQDGCGRFRGRPGRGGFDEIRERRGSIEEHFKELSLMEPVAGPSSSPVPSVTVKIEPGEQRGTGISEFAEGGDGRESEIPEARAVGRRKKRGKKKPLPPGAPVEHLPDVSSDIVERPMVCDVSRSGRQFTFSIPPAPDKGSVGRSRALVSNCWNMSFEPKTVFMYDAEILRLWRFDDETGRELELRTTARERRELLGVVVKNSFPDGVLFDGGRIIYSDNKLPDITETGVERNTEFVDPILLERRKIRYKIMLTKTQNTGDIIEFLERPNGQTVCSLQDSLRILDCAAKLACDGPFVCLGRMAIFDKKATRTILSKLLQIHRGFVMTVRPQWKLRINIDMTYKAFFPLGNLADILYEKYGDNMCQFPEEIKRDISGIKMRSPKIYRDKPNDPLHTKDFTAYGVTKLPVSKQMISDINKSVQQYFREKYQLELKYPYLPCIEINNHHDAFYPMELLEVTFLQKANNTLDLAAEIIRCSAVKPEERFQELENFCRHQLLRGPALLRRYGMSVIGQMQTVTGRELPVPSADFGSGYKQLGRGKWFVDRFHSPANVDGVIRFVVISVPPNRRDDDARRRLAADLLREGQSKGMHLQLVDDFALRPEALKEKLSALSMQVDLVVFVLGDSFSYSKIKVLGDIKLGVRTQCVQSSTLRKRGVISNLLLKINAKLGGINWVLQPFDNNEHIMVFGADVTHPSPKGTQLRRSVGAVTGSLSGNLMVYRAIVFQQMTRRPQQTAINEVIDKMQSIVLELLKEYGRRNNGPPERLIFYRDGVSEGQFETVVVEEMCGIQRACAELFSREIPITFIVVQKRHHVRLKPQNDGNNVAPGTVVDTEITMKSEFDFYLCSQEGIQGTSRPAHYRVLHDDNNYRSDALQQFTFALCHAYARCPRSVSYPAPTYYAHLAAFRGRDWLASNENETSLIQDGCFMVHQKQLGSLFFC